mgnify:CR=1 FL=1
MANIVYVEIETLGERFSAEEVFGSVEAVKTVSDLYMPISGKIIELNLPKATIPEKDQEGNFQDKYLSGKHLVTSITHSFENKYTMNITCCKDSLLFDLEA